MHFTTANHTTRNNQLLTVSTGVAQNIISLNVPQSLKTKNETVTETKGTHNHECDPGECKAKEVVNQIKRRAQ